MAPTPPPAEPIAFVVTLVPGATEVEASVVRSGIRAFASVASLRPVGESAALTAAREQERAGLRADVLPIWDRLVADVKGRCDEATEEFALLTDEQGWPRLADSPTPQRAVGNGHSNGAQRAVNGVRNGQVPQQRDARHAAPGRLTPGY